MKAWTLNEPAPIETRPLVLADVPIPIPAEDQVLISVSACGICRTDLHVVEGELPVHRTPLIPGHQTVGRVTALGDRLKILRSVIESELHGSIAPVECASSAARVVKIFASARCSQVGLPTAAMRSMP